MTPPPQFSVISTIRFIVINALTALKLDIKRLCLIVKEENGTKRTSVPGVKKMTIWVTKVE